MDKKSLLDDLIKKYTLKHKKSEEMFEKASKGNEFALRGT